LAKVKLTKKQLLLLKTLSHLNPELPFWKQEKEFRTELGAAKCYMRFVLRRIHVLEEKGLIQKVTVGRFGGCSFVLTEKGREVIAHETV
jgi:DNA-binding MarR family transcriptional regulator